MSYLAKNYNRKKLSFVRGKGSFLYTKNGIKYLDFVNGFSTPKKDFMIEEDIYSTFKKLGLKKENFEIFIENRKSKWRYMNSGITKYVAHKYQANSLVTYKDTEDFEEHELEHIRKSSPVLHQQSIIPKFELNRLRKGFENYENKESTSDIIVLNKKDKFIFSINLFIFFSICKIFFSKKRLTTSNLSLFILISVETSSK